jgi:hypothetical protein
MVTSINLPKNSILGFQIHAYKSGHQLLYSTILLANEDQDTIDRLSDISGSLRPGEIFEPYFTCYPLPSRKHYVIARTWQDIEAARSGCVITKSLIIQQEQWTSTKNVFKYFQVLLRMSINIDYKINDFEFPHEDDLPILESRPLDALIEALFVNKREPVVLFDFPNGLIALIRILSVQWPSLRNRFAACTYSLSQRTIGGKPFDLLFAPATAKSKFSTWPGIFIDPLSSQKQKKVIRFISQSVFENKIPSLLQPELRNFFNAEIEVNEETFRLSLLWSDLSSKLKSEQPFYAILGLLDVANVLPQQATVLLYKSIRNDIGKAVLSAPDLLPSTEALNFITSLLLRHKRKLLDRELFHMVRHSITRISEKEPLSAISFLQSNNNPARKIPSSVYAGVGDGMSDSLRDLAKSELIRYVKLPELGLMLASTSHKFAELIVYFFERNHPDWISFLKMIFADEIGISKSRAAKKIAIAITENSPPEILELILNNATEKTYKTIVNMSTVSNVLGNSKFIKTILENAMRLNLIDYLLQLFFKAEKHDYVGTIMMNLLSRKPELFDDIFQDQRLQVTTAADIIEQLFTDPNEQFLALIRASKEKSNYLLNSPASMFISKKTTASILTYANIPLEISLSSLDELPIEALNSVNNYKVTLLLARAMKELNNKYDLTLQSIIKKYKKINVNYLYEAAISHHNPAGRLIGNLEIILNNDSRFQSKLTENVDYVSRLLRDNLTGFSSNVIQINWIRILNQSGKFKDLQKQAAVFMLDYAYYSAQDDPTNFIEAAFPIIYRSFLKGKGFAAALNSFFFPDWDKCKTLREQLVNIYFNKNWPTFGLLSVAYSANILKEVIKSIAHKKNGRSILKQALLDTKQSPKRQQILKSIATMKL